MNNNKIVFIYILFLFIFYCYIGLLVMPPTTQCAVACITSAQWEIDLYNWWNKNETRK